MMSKNFITFCILVVTILLSNQTQAQCWEWAQCIGLDRPPTSASVFIDHIESSEAHIFLLGRNEDLNPIFLDGHKVDPGTFLLKIDASDKVVQALSISDVSVEVSQIRTDDDGAVYLLGEIEEEVKVLGTELSPVEISNFFIAKIDPTGQVEYLQTLVYDDFVYLNDMVANDAGGLYLLGSWLVSSHLDIYLLELDANGEEASSALFGGSKNQVGDLITMDQSNNIIIRGEFDDEISIANVYGTASGSSNDFFLAKFDPMGSLAWLHVGDSETFVGYGLVTDDQDNVYMGGSYKGAMTFDGGITLPEAAEYDVFVTKYNAAGDQLWATPVGGAMDEKDFDLAVDANYHSYLALELNEGLNFGGQWYAGPENRGLFVGELDSDGAPVAAVWTDSEEDIYGDAGIALRSNRLYTAGQFNQQQEFGVHGIIGSYSSGFIASANFAACELKPYATCDVVQTNVQTAIALAPLENDYFVESLDNYEIIQAPEHGSLMIGSNQYMQYTPEAGFQGVDHSTYRICSDNHCDTAVISFNVVNYLPNTLAEIRVDNDGDYWPDSLNAFADLEGVVYGFNLKSGDNEAGYKFTIINDDNSAGMLVFSEHEFLDYEVQEGDRIRVLGRIYESNGMTCILPDFIEKLSENNPLVTPEDVTYVSEVHENRLIRFSQKMWLEDESEWTGPWSTGATIDLFDGDIVWDMRIDDDSDIINWTLPPDTFYITGIGYQRDHVAPFDTCYRILPRSQLDFEEIIVDGIEDKLIDLDVQTYPNPANEFIVVRTEEQLETISLYDAQGKLLLRRVDPDWIEIITIKEWPTGTYFLKVENQRGRHTEPIQIQR